MRCYFRYSLDTSRRREHLGLASVHLQNNGFGRYVRNWRYATVGFIAEFCAVPDQTPSGPDRRDRGCQFAERGRVSRSKGCGQGILRSQRRKLERETRAGGAAIFQRDGGRMQFGARDIFSCRTSP